MVNHPKNSLAIFILIVLVLLTLFVVLPLFGYSVFSFNFSPKYSEQESLSKLNIIQQKYNAINSYPTNQSDLELYINESTELLGNSSGNAAKIINIDVESATAFYHLLRADNESTPLVLGNCDKILLANSRAYANESILHSNKALTLLNTINLEQANFLRQNQKQIIENYKQIASNLKVLINDNCGTA